jgi:hypothetical protein
LALCSGFEELAMLREKPVAADAIGRPAEAEEQRFTVSAPAASAGWPALAPHVSAFPLDEELVLHDARSGEVFILNLTAARICALFDGSNTVAVAAQALVTGFGLPYHEALADVNAFITELREADLLARD